MKTEKINLTHDCEFCKKSVTYKNEKIRSKKFCKRLGHYHNKCWKLYQKEEENVAKEVNEHLRIAKEELNRMQNTYVITMKPCGIIDKLKAFTAKDAMDKFLENNPSFIEPERLKVKKVKK